MDIRAYFEWDGKRGYFRPTGSMSLHQVTRVVTEAILLARHQGIPELLVNILGLEGFESPGLGNRYFLVKQWAIAANSQARVAMVAQAKMIAPDKFGVTVARNLGFVANIFATEHEAIAWLDSQCHLS